MYDIIECRSDDVSSFVQVITTIGLSSSQRGRRVSYKLQNSTLLECFNTDCW